MLETLWNRLGDMPGLMRRLFTVANVVLLSGAMIELALLSWQLVPRPPAPPAPGPTGGPAPSVAQPSDTAPATARDLARWHLFGEVRKGRPAPGPVIRKELPETRLNLSLRGVVSSAAGRTGGAIIDTGNGQEVYYPVGSSLPGGARLQSVHKDHVVLERNGRLETLKLPRNDLGGTPDQGRQAMTPRMATPPAGQGLAQLRQQILDNPQQLLNVFSVEPYTQHGRFVGYRLRPGRDRALFALTGLHDGDIVTAINGIRLDAPAKAMSALRGLAQASEASVSVLRNGRRESFRIDLRR